MGAARDSQADADARLGEVAATIRQVVRLTWVFPTHFLTVWMTGLPARHAGPGGGLAWALAWAAGAVAVAGAVLTAAIRTARTRRRARPGSVLSQFTAGLRAGLRDVGRNRVLWALLAARLTETALAAAIVVFRRSMHAARGPAQASTARRRARPGR